MGLDLFAQPRKEGRTIPPVLEVLSLRQPAHPGAQIHLDHIHAQGPVAVQQVCIEVGEGHYLLDVHRLLNLSARG